MIHLTDKKKTKKNKKTALLVRREGEQPSVEVENQVICCAANTQQLTLPDCFNVPACSCSRIAIR